MKAFLSNDNLVTLVGLMNESAGAYVNTASISAQVYQSDYATAIGSSFTLAYVSTSNGNYAGTMPYTLNVAADAQYVLHISGDGGGLHYDSWIPLIFERRTS